MDKPNSAAELLRQITASPGQGYLNRAHQRSFSLNVFQMNAVELVEAAQRVKDPEQGMAFMMEKNREAGRQAHRELSRHVHNFVSSALTLVEHTRVFMRKHYAGTEVLAAYEKQVEATFLKSPIAQFVQGLRNYMLHRGLPNSSMFLNFTSDPDAKNGSGKAETGVRYDTASLLDWKDWKPLARAYLEQAGKYLDLHGFVEEYVALVNQFHGWLDTTLATHHQSDLQEFGLLQAQLQAISPARPSGPVTVVEAPETAVEPFEFTPQQIVDLDRIATDLLAKVRQLHFRQSPQEFPTERPTTPITDRDLIGQVTFWGQEVDGQTAFGFIQHEGKSHGLSQSDFDGVDSLIDVALGAAWARTSLSRDFVEKAFIDWARKRFEGDEKSFAEVLSAGAREEVTKVEVWAPMANVEVECAFDFGPVRIEPVTAAVIQRMRSSGPQPRPEQEPQVTQLFDKLKDDIQGYAAVVVPMDAEPSFAEERALRVAQDVVGLLRFFSPAGSASFLFSPVALAGAEYIPQSKLIVLSDGAFSYTHGLLPKRMGHWRVSAQQISELTSGPLVPAASLVMLEGLSEFSLAVRASLLTYSKGTTLVDPLDRLRNCLSALEGVFLKHEMEPRAHSIANRLSFILARGDPEREAVKQVIRQIYWLQSQPQLSAYGRREEELITVFTSYAYSALRAVLANSPNFETTAQFVMAVEREGTVSQSSV
jgi:hypothetical protein